MKQSQNAPKLFLSLLLAFLSLAVVFTPLATALPIVLPANSKNASTPAIAISANNVTAFPPKGRDWRRPHTPLSLLKGGLRRPLAPTNVIVTRQTNTTTTSPLSPKEQTAVYLKYLRSQVEGQVEKVPGVRKEDNKASGHADPEAVEAEEDDEEQEEKLEKRGVIEITHEMLKTGAGLPHPIDLEDVPPHYRQNPHILAQNMPKNESQQDKIQNDLIGRSKSYIVLDDNRNTSKPAGPGLVYATREGLGEGHAITRNPKKLNGTIYPPSYPGRPIKIANTLDHPPPPPPPTHSMGEKKILGKRKPPKNVHWNPAGDEAVATPSRPDNAKTPKKGIVKTDRKPGKHVYWNDDGDEAVATPSEPDNAKTPKKGIVKTDRKPGKHVFWNDDGDEAVATPSEPDNAKTPKKGIMKTDTKPGKYVFWNDDRDEAVATPSRPDNTKTPKKGIVKTDRKPGKRVFWNDDGDKAVTTPSELDNTKTPKKGIVKTDRKPGKHVFWNADGDEAVTTPSEPDNTKRPTKGIRKPDKPVEGKMKTDQPVQGVIKTLRPITGIIKTGRPLEGIVETVRYKEGPVRIIRLEGGKVKILDKRPKSKLWDPSKDQAVAKRPIIDYTKVPKKEIIKTDGGKHVSWNANGDEAAATPSKPNNAKTPKKGIIKTDGQLKKHVFWNENGDEAIATPSEPDNAKSPKKGILKPPGEPEFYEEVPKPKVPLSQRIKEWRWDKPLPIVYPDGKKHYEDQRKKHKEIRKKNREEQLQRMLPHRKILYEDPVGDEAAATPSKPDNTKKGKGKGKLKPPAKNVHWNLAGDEADATPSKPDNTKMPKKGILKPPKVVPKPPKIDRTAELYKDIFNHKQPVMGHKGIFELRKDDADSPPKDIPPWKARPGVAEPPWLQKQGHRDPAVDRPKPKPHPPSDLNKPLPRKPFVRSRPWDPWGRDKPLPKEPPKQTPEELAAWYVEQTQETRDRVAEEKAEREKKRQKVTDPKLKELPRTPDREFPNRLPSGKSVYDYGRKVKKLWRNRPTKGLPLFEGKVLEKANDLIMMSIANKRFHMWNHGRGYNGATWTSPEQHHKPEADNWFPFRGLMESPWELEPSDE